MQKKLKPNQITEIIELYQKGHTPKEIGKIFNIHNSSVTRILRKNNIKRTQAAKKISEEQKQYIIKKYLNNISSEKIAEELKISSSTVCRILKKNKIEIRPNTENKRKYWIDDSWFDKIDTQEKAYFLGLFWSDGNINKKDNNINIRLQKLDDKVLIKLSLLLYKKNNIKYYDNCACLNIYSQKIKKQLIKLGASPNKSKTIKFPSWMPKNLLPSFLRGLIDGDGCISVKKSSMGVVMISGNKYMINSISEILTEKKLSHSTYHNKEKNSYDLQLKAQEDTKTFIDWIYDNQTICINRKLKSKNKYINRYNNKYSQIQPENIGNITKTTTLSSEILQYNKQKLTKLKINNTTQENKKLIAKSLFDYYKNNGFPYPNYHKDELIKDWENLKSFNTKNLLLKDKVETNSQIGLKIFKQFAKCYFDISSKSKPSMLSAFNDDEKLLSVIENRLGISYKEIFNITDNMIRQGFRNSFASTAVSIFKPVVAKTIYDIFTPINGIVYDFSMGMGQRMLGAISSKNNLTYIGTDPWVEALDTNKQISNFINTKRIELYNESSENFIKEKYINKIDLAFSSPPYYDTEIYCKKHSQAYFNKSYSEFLNIWWKRTINNIHKLLNNNGLFILNISSKIEKDMINICKNKFLIKEKLNLTYNNNKSSEIIIIMEKS